MSKVASYHTDSKEYPPTHREVYHDYDNCQYGKAIKDEHRLKGDGGKSRCLKCKALD